MANDSADKMFGLGGLLGSIPEDARVGMEVGRRDILLLTTCVLDTLQGRTDVPQADREHLGNLIVRMGTEVLPRLARVAGITPPPPGPLN